MNFKITTFITLLVSIFGVIQSVVAQDSNNTFRGLDSCPYDKIAFTGYDRDITYYLHIINPDTSDSTRILSSTRDSFYWSPDACYVAYLLHREGTLMEGQYDVYIMDIVTTETVRVTTSGYNTNPVWSPDSSQIAFASGEGTARTIYVVDIASLFDNDSELSEPLQIRGDYDFNVLPTWSSDGGKIAFESCTRNPYPDQLDVDLSDVRCSVHMANADGSGVRSLTSGLGKNALHPSWSPDSGRIAFVAYENDDYTDADIYLTEVNETNFLQLSSVHADYVELAWSPDSRQIAFVSSSDLDLSKSDIYIINIEEQDILHLNEHNTRFAAFHWSPDSSQLAFASTMDGDWDIYVVNHDGSGLKNLTNSIETVDCCLVAGAYGFNWSRNGQQIVFDVAPLEGNFDIFIMDSDGSNVQQLTNHEYDDHRVYPVWLPQ